MKKINNKGFTLVEVLAVVVILSVFIAIMVPSVNYLIEKNKEDNYNELKSSLIQATKVLFSDYRYEVSVIDNCNNDEDGLLDISQVGKYKLTEEWKKEVNKIPIQILVDEGNVSVNSAGNIVNPKDNNTILNLNDSYVLVKYLCATKDFSYEIGELNWE